MDDIFSSSPFPRPIAIVTGAAGGMGRACAHRLAGSHALVLTDVNPIALDALAAELKASFGTDVKTIVGDIADESVVAAIADAADADRVRLLVHTAGLSPALGGWQDIVHVNLIGTARLLRAVEPLLRSGFVGIFLSSTARCFVAPPGEQLRGELDDPFGPDIANRLMALLGNNDGIRAANAYAYTKWWIYEMVHRRAAQWAEKGARILSISPGFVLTPMTRNELANRPEMADLLKQTPASRWGTADDIANLVEFLQSDKASFMTGADVVIDGGLSARMLKGEAG